MKIFYAKIFVNPQRSNKSFDLIKGAIADIWVSAVDNIDAMTIALAYLDRELWTVQNVESDFVENTLEQIVDLYKPLATVCYANAKKFGVGCHLTGYKEY